MEGKTIVGIVILNYITWQETEQCICSIKKTLPAEMVKIYVVDNASPEKQEIYNVCEREHVELIYNPRNNGYAAGNNIGIARALQDDCDFILISNNDIRFHSNCIFGMYKFLETHLEYGIAAPKVLQINGSIQKGHFKKQPLYGDIWKTQTVFRFLKKKSVDVLYGDTAYYEEQQDLFAPCGCCFLMSADCARQVTPFDETTFLYEEENIIGIRMKQLGMKIRYLPNCQVTHYHDQTTRLVKPFALICWACSEVYYCKKYLGLGWWKIHFLYWYRMLIFLFHGVHDKAYCQQWSRFLKDTKKYLKMK